MLAVAKCLGREFALFLFDEFACMLDSVIDVGSEVFFTYQFYKASAMHGLHGLFVRMAEDQLYAIFGTVVVEVFQGIHSRCIKRRNAAHADDQVLGERLTEISVMRSVMPKNMGPLIS